jgi:hypothetical protein
MFLLIKGHLSNEEKPTFALPMLRLIQDAAYRGAEGGEKHP